MFAGNQLHSAGRKGCWGKGPALHHSPNVGQDQPEDEVKVRCHLLYEAD